MHGLAKKDQGTCKYALPPALYKYFSASTLGGKHLTHRRALKVRAGQLFRLAPSTPHQRRASGIAIHSISFAGPTWPSPSIGPFCRDSRLGRNGWTMPFRAKGSTRQHSYYRPREPDVPTTSGMSECSPLPNFHRVENR